MDAVLTKEILLQFFAKCEEDACKPPRREITLLVHPKDLPRAKEYFKNL